MHSQDGTVEPWGNESYGGKLPDDLRLKLQLKLIQGIRAVDIYSAKLAFAAKFTDGSVEAWGFTIFGGTIPAAVYAKLHNGIHVVDIY